MIEALAQYFVEQGYEVKAFPKVLYITKSVKGRQLGYCWYISRLELTYSNTLFLEAEYILQQLKKEEA